MESFRRQFLSLATIIVAGGLAACQSTPREPAEPAQADAAPVAAVADAPVSDSLFLGLIFPYAPATPSGPATKAALLMTRQGAPLEQVELGRFEGRAMLLDSLAKRQFPTGALLGFRTATADTAGTDVAVLRIDDTTLHVLSRPMPSGKDTAAFQLLKKVPIAAHTYVRVVR